MSNQLLLCDDDVYILRAAEIKLRNAGYEVRTASDGQAAWEAIQEHRPDLVLTDCQMPRMSGLQLLECIRGDARYADLPVMLLTAKGYELPLDELRERWGVLKVIAKPFSPREVLALVDAALAEPSAT